MFFSEAFGIPLDLGNDRSSTHATAPGVAIDSLKTHQEPAGSSEKEQ